MAVMLISRSTFRLLSLVSLLLSCCVGKHIRVIQRKLTQAISFSALSALSFQMAPMLPIQAAEELTTRQKVIRQAETFLTNHVLEKFRIMDQVADDADALTSNKVLLLYPILEKMKTIEAIRTTIQQGERVAFERAAAVLGDATFDARSLKRVFNRYSDNIFYVAPERANLYLAGGAVPNSRQTEQYLLRNIILTDISNVRDDIISALRDASTCSDGKLCLEEQSLADTLDDCDDAIDSFRKYLKLADPEDVKTANDVWQGNHLSDAFPTNKLVSIKEHA